MKDFVILESVLIGRQYSVRAYTEEEAIEKYEKGDVKLIRYETINCQMEEINEEGVRGDAETEQLKGRGGIYRCPACKSEDLEACERDLVDHEYMVQSVRCNGCGREYKETWKAIEWKSDA